MMNLIEKRLDKVTRLRNYAIEEKKPHKFKQAQYLIDQLNRLKEAQSINVTNKLKQIYANS